jgi:hypothetical protein
MSVTALKKIDERAELRRAVTDAQEARAAVDRQRVSIERGTELVAEAVANLAAASAAVNTARETHAQHIASAITGGGSPTTTGLIPAARAHERDAEDELEALKSALSSLQAGLADMESDAAVAGRAVDAALAQALMPVARDLLVRTRDHYLKFMATDEALHAVTAVFNHWDGGTEIAQQANRAGSLTDADARTLGATKQQWKAALEALKRDADAPLPPIED